MAVNSYSDLVAQFHDFKIQNPDFARRLSELISVNELLTALSSVQTLAEILDILLLTILGQHPCLRGAILIKSEDGWRQEIAKGLRNTKIPLEDFPLDGRWDTLPEFIGDPESLAPEHHALRQLVINDLFQFLVPIQSEGELVGLVCLGRSMFGIPSDDKKRVLSTIAGFGGILIRNSLFRANLEQANRQLQHQLFQLNTLYEISSSFARCYEDEDAFQVLSKNLMGQFLISRCVVLPVTGGKPLFQKGIKAHSSCCQTFTDQIDLLKWQDQVRERSKIQNPCITAFMGKHKLRYALAIIGDSARHGLLLLGDRLDRKDLTPSDSEFMLSIVQQAAASLDSVALQKEALEKKRMERELQLAREIQQTLLPKGVPLVTGYELAVEMRPYNQVGGDFYDFMALSNGKLSFCLADVSGKSLPACMIMSTAQASLRALSSFSSLQPKEVIDRLNLHLCESTQSNKFVTMFYAVLDPKTHTLEYINAGHNRPILVKSDGSTTLLCDGGMMVGMFPSACYKVGKIHFAQRTELLIYTDGLSEVKNSDGEEYGDDRLAETFASMPDYKSLEVKKNTLIETIMGFSNNKMVDDMTLLLLRRGAQ